MKTTGEQIWGEVVKRSWKSNSYPSFSTKGKGNSVFFFSGYLGLRCLESWLYMAFHRSHSSRCNTVQVCLTSISFPFPSVFYFFSPLPTPWVSVFMNIHGSFSFCFCFILLYVNCSHIAVWNGDKTGGNWFKHAPWQGKADWNNTLKKIPGFYRLENIQVGEARNGWKEA